MNKVKITQAQAHAIEMIKEQKGRLTLLDEHIHDFFRASFCLSRKQIDTEILIKALYIGYEVEPEPFEVGDWVFMEKHPDINASKVLFIKNKEIELLGNNKQIITVVELDKTRVLNNGEIINIEINVKSEFLRHATPEEIAEEKERRFWKRNGRDVWELKYDDLLSVDDCVEEFMDLTDGYIYFTSGKYGGFETMKKNMKVVCFAESRMDVNSNE